LIYKFPKYTNKQLAIKMNQNIINLSFLITKNKLSKLLILTNYSAKLLCILHFNNLYQNIKSKQFFILYKKFININKIIKFFELNINISDIDKIKNIHYISKMVKYIPLYITNLVNLGLIDLRYNEINFVPNKIGHLINLKLFDLSFNKIKTMPSQVGNLINLKILFFRNNFLTFIPTELGNLKNLHTLYLCNNQITTIPTQIGNLFELQSLSFENNKIKIIPNEIENLNKLKYFWINKNCLNSSSSLKLVNLYKLYIDRSQIKLFKKLYNPKCKTIK
jgi:Leucine-rich repeat (LRR) protein